MAAPDPAAVLERPAPAPDLELRYGDGTEQVADLWWPVPLGERRTRARALVLLLHGGFWKAAYDRRHLRALGSAVARAGHVVVSVEYRRVGQPGGGWPGTFDDVALALDRVPALVAEAAGANGDPDVMAAVAAADGRVVLVGHSAGGHLALWSAARTRLPAGSRWHAAQPVTGVLALAPVGDLAAADAAGLGGGAVERLLATRDPGDPEPISHADPATLLPVSVPTVVVQGRDDVEVPVGLVRAYVARAHAAGDDRVRLVELPGTEHYGLIDPAWPTWPTVLAALTDLVRAP